MCHVCNALVLPNQASALGEEMISMQQQAAEGIETAPSPVSPMHMLESAAAKLGLMVEVVPSWIFR